MARETASAWLEWQKEMGADEAIGDQPTDMTRKADPSPASKVTQMPQPKLSGAAAATAQARELADQCSTIEELREAIIGFNGCALKKTANKTVVSDGNPKADLMLIGEAPGAEEDVQGIPFCGPSGKLLDNMLRSIGYDRTRAYISNTIFWRPPGNRAPTPEELMICRPFVEKHIALVNPKLLICVGGTAVKGLLGIEQGITKMRGKQYAYQTPYLEHEVPVMVTFHPSYLLRQPGQKKQAWQDMLAIQKFLEHA